MLQSRQAWIIFAIVAGTIGLATPTRARAAPATVKVVDISGPSPFAPDGCGVDISQLGSEYEPDLAVNPKDQRNIIAIWSQDKQISNVVATSHDGGEHWTQVLIPGLSKCTGGTADNALDARVSFGADGTAYLSSQVVETKHVRLFWSLLVNRSTDGGLSWSDPVTIDQAGPWPALALDFPVLVADPRRLGTAYVVWSRFHDLFTAPAAPQFFARTTDAGVTWTPPATMPITPQPTQTAFSSQIRVLSDGALVNVFIQIPVDVAPIGPTSVWAMRSQDQGDSWSAPTFVADVPANVVTDPDNGRGLAGGVSFVTPSVATGPGNEVFVAWHLIESTSSSRILFAKSLDGGVTWSAPAALAVEGTQAFKPTVAVSPAGMVGVTYFDFRDDVPGDVQLTTDVWFRHSQDGGATWSETHVAGPFDIRPAPYPGAFPLGDYFGLTPIANDGFGAIFVQTISPQTGGVTDVFFARIEVPPAAQDGDGGCAVSPGHAGGGCLVAWLIVPMLILHWARRHTAALACAAVCVASAHTAQAGINVWTSHGPGGGPVRALAIDPITPTTLYAGTFGFEAPLENGPFKSTDSGRTWNRIHSGDVLALAVDPTTPETLYVGGQLGLGQDGLGHVFKSTDSGDAWNDTGFPFQLVCAVSALAIDPVIPGTLYAGTTQFFPCKGGSLGLLRSSDGGTSWIKTSLGGSVHALAIDPSAPATIYAGMSNGVFKSTDGGNTWSDTGIGSAVPVLGIDPTTPDTVYAGAETQVYKSTDGAHTWRDTGLIAAATSLGIDPTGTNTLYVGSSDGVFKSTDGGNTWQTLNGGLASTFVYALAIDPVTPPTLYAGTEDGVFSIQQVSACAGDCNNDGAVMVDELLILVNVALGDASISACLAGDHNQDGTITVDEILVAVRNALNECPVPPTPPITPTASATPTNTPTPSVTSTVTGTPPTSTPTATAPPTV